MKVIQIDKWKGKPFVTIVEIPQPKHGEVLIKVGVAPINPLGIFIYFLLSHFSFGCYNHLILIFNYN